MSTCMTDTVFYSWQSDLSNATNRGLIEAALEKAAKAIREDATIELSPRVERDTANVPGSPDIVATIFQKIDSASAFVCDVSTINALSPQEIRRCPNPNVLVELGYAIGKLGWERVILVLNTAFGRVEDLPFDLRQRRAIAYESFEADRDRATPRRRLQTALEARLREILVVPARTVATPAQLAIRAIGEDHRSAESKVRTYAADLWRQVREHRPSELGSGVFDAVITALQNTITTVAEFATVCSAVAEHRAEHEAVALIQGLSPIACGYDFQPALTDSNHQASYEYCRFLGHELFVILVASLLREERFDILNRVFSESIQGHNSDGLGIIDFTFLDYATDLMNRNDPHGATQAKLLKERHSTGLLEGACPFDLFMAADVLAFVRGQVQAAEDPWEARKSWWRPWSSLYLVSPPEFLLKSRSKAYAGRLLPAVGTPNLTDFRERFSARRETLRRLWQRSYPMHPGLPPLDIGVE
jgi:hypothetical protein